MAEFYMKSLLEASGMGGDIHVSSAGVTEEKVGAQISIQASRLLKKQGLVFWYKHARKLIKLDYELNDLLIAMDFSSMARARIICGGDPEEKICMLMDFTERPGSIVYPERTEDYSAAWAALTEGCRGLLDHIKERGL